MNCYAIPAVIPHSLLLTTTPGAPRNTARYKVYVILTPGAERGSNPVTVMRPL